MLIKQYAQYNTPSASIKAAVAQTGSSPGAVAPPPQPPVGQQPIGHVEQAKEAVSAAEKPLVSPPPINVAPGHSILSREEKVEYRDQDGNLLDEEQVKALEGKVSFKTRYETRTRLVDAQGNEIAQPEDSSVAPPHPDVDGPERETVGVPEQAAKAGPNSQRDVEADEKKERKVEKSETGAAKPGSDGNEATKA
jgi:dolichyl-phosphate-mannose-protein mannosyltransferase